MHVLDSLDISLYAGALFTDHDLAARWDQLAPAGRLKRLSLRQLGPGTAVAAELVKLNDFRKVALHRWLELTLVSFDFVVKVLAAALTLDVRVACCQIGWRYDF